MNKHRTILFAVVLVAITASVVWAQRSWRGFDSRDRGDRGDIPMWSNEPGFEQDVFTFVRVIYSSGWGRGRGGGGWRTDWPDADLNFSYRLQQLTALKVDPEGRHAGANQSGPVQLPVYLHGRAGPVAVRRGGGQGVAALPAQWRLLMVDDFWGESGIRRIFTTQIKRVFPEREPVDLPLEHPIFHCVFDLKEKPQVPSMHHVQRYRGTPV
jgi:hypothetical protein